MSFEYVLKIERKCKDSKYLLTKRQKVKYIWIQSPLKSIPFHYVTFLSAINLNVFFFLPNSHSAAVFHGRFSCMYQLVSKALAYEVEYAGNCGLYNKNAPIKVTVSYNLVQILQLIIIINSFFYQNTNVLGFSKARRSSVNEQRPKTT